jgi:hypothetical protein
MSSKRPVSLEDLLRLKRAERPAPEYWADYERQLRAKQLAALVAKRPWWHSVRNGFVGLSRLHVGVGAAAVLAISFVSLRETPRLSPAATSGDAPAREAVATAVEVDAPVLEVNRAAAASVAASTGAVPAAPAAFVAMSEPAVAADGPVGGAVATEAATPSSTFTVPAFPAPEVAPETPSARYIAANFAAAQETIGTALLSEVQGFEVRGAVTRVARVDPLQQMTPPGENRRANRLLTAMVSPAATDASFRTTERVANRISPDELYDQVRRFGTRHGGLNVKF